MLLLALGCARPVPPPPPPIAAPAASITVPVHPADASVGPPGAKLVLVEFTDFQCPFCQRMWEPVKQLLADNQDLRLVLKHYPISGTCNPDIAGERHAGACPAAKAAICAQAQGRFLEMADAMYGHQDTLTEGTIAGLALGLGLDTEAFSRCLVAPETQARIAEDVRAANAAGLTGTPSFYLLRDGVWTALAPDALPNLTP